MSPVSEADDNSVKERAHLVNVVKSFDAYLPYCLAANNARRRSYYSLPLAHQQLLSDLGPCLPLPVLDGGSDDDTSLPLQQPKGFGFRARLDEIDDRIRRNADLLEQIVQDSTGFLGTSENSLDKPSTTSFLTSTGHNSPTHQHSGTNQIRKQRTISGQEVDKLQSTLKQLVRDWSQEGKHERDLVYVPIMEAVQRRFKHVAFDQRGQINILVPGAGLGRLAFDIATQGYSCQGNEFSFYMLLTSHYILNKTVKKEQHTIYPFIHSSSNWRTANDMLRPISIPDVLPSQLPPTSNFSMIAGEFCQVYAQVEEAQAWDVVVTCFFIDTAKNVLRYLETINHLLPVGGCWINAGPLLWHFENQKGGSDSLSIELTLDEVKDLVVKLGFEIEEQKTLAPMTYTGVLDSMLMYNYVPEFFVCRKVKDVAAAPAV